MLRRALQRALMYFSVVALSACPHSSWMRSIGTPDFHMSVAPLPFRSRKPKDGIIQLMQLKGSALAIGAHGAAVLGAEVEVLGHVVRRHVGGQHVAEERLERGEAFAVVGE
jgi:hypothetical protein